ncbi:hypothetical protein HPP92_007471 [Vanilla planifolia]|uniref:Beta-glucosidase 12-like n=1 Tax=Vanilla planifolia TaxID=51239 RepID=A0A835RAJ6_VANPL|nr:hypothetical protein HPP92_007471 [Vanilla planifolia]
MVANACSSQIKHQLPCIFMGSSAVFIVLLLLRQLIAAQGATAAVKDDIHRSDFPVDFAFGTSTSAYQVEGAYNVDGRGPSIWDSFTHLHPDGRLDGGINQKGVDFYNNLINSLLARGIQPYVTLFHWDAPQALEDKYGGFLSSKIVDDFRDYTNICFKLFGDRVKHWITLNEPMIFSVAGYALGNFAPGRCSSFISKCNGGDSATEPYIVGHHLLLSHAAAVKVYRKQYQTDQKGKIGITLVSPWLKPYYNNKIDEEAMARDLDFSFGWFMDPITQGDYPFIMRALVRERLPQFSKEEAKSLKGSFDFLGLNYYTTHYVKSVPFFSNSNVSFISDIHATDTGIRNGIPIGPASATSGFFSYPPGLKDILLYIKDKYNSPEIYITENGVSEFNNATLTLKEALNDYKRVDFHRRHLLYLQRAIKAGVKVKGYFVWSLLDNFEWSSGYTVRFGIYFVDYKDGLKRYAKSSVYWFQKFLK